MIDRAFIDKMRAVLPGRLSPKRYQHCERAAELCRCIALRDGYDADKAEFIGLAHDIAKELSAQQVMEMFETKDISINQYERDNLYLLHGLAGAIILQTEFNIQDDEILNAVRYHIGRPAMSQPEKIIFLADHIDKCARMGIDVQYYIEEPDIDTAIFRMLREVLEYYIAHDIEIEELTYNTYDYMLYKLQNKDQTAAGQVSAISDEEFDQAMATQRKHRVALASVGNARDLGGTVNAEGRSVRRNMLIRSARLCTMSGNDAKLLKEMGISHVIDLRTEDEIRANPDANTDTFTYVSCPLPSVELSARQGLLRDWFQRSRNEQQAWYLSEYLKKIDMKDMYERVLRSPESVSSIRRVMDILLSHECSGALFHCTSGKDRTGVIAILIYSLLQCGYEDIRSDYQASALHTYIEAEALADMLMENGYKDSGVDEIRYYCGIGGDMFDHIQKIISDEFGTVENYLSDVLKMTPEMMTQFREKFLEPAI